MRSSTLEYIADEVGGVDALMKLDAEPLPDEEFDWAGIPDEIRPAVQAILDECDALRRRASRPRAPHRHATLPRARRDERPGALPAQGLTGARRGRRCLGDRAPRTARSVPGRSPMASKDLLAHFGITGSVSDRARSR